MPTTGRECPRCGAENPPTRWVCGQCQTTLGAGNAEAAAPTEPDDGPALAPPTAAELGDGPADRPRHRGYVSLKTRTGRSRSDDYFSHQNALIALGLGAVMCWIDSLGGIGHMALHFIAALTHEIGHAAFATACGAPSFPVISLRGHAAALHSGQFYWLAVGIWLFTIYMAYTMRREGKPWQTYAVLAVAYPLFALTPAWEVLFLLAGHLGELAFAGVFLWRAWTGGFTESMQERFAYASLGWFLWAQNLVFHFGLIFSPADRARYHSNGSFGLENDYIRVARDHLGVPLEMVALGMMLVTLIGVPLAVFWAVRRDARSGAR